MASKSKPLIYLQVLIAVVAITWFSYDFFHTIFNGVTYKLRFDSQLHYDDNAFAFFIAVGIKLAIFLLFYLVVKRLL